MRATAVVGIVLSLSGAAACATASAQTRATRPGVALEPPPPPPRVIVPAAVEPDPAPVSPPAPVTPSPTPPTTPNRPSPSRPDRTEPPVTTPVRPPDLPVPPPLAPPAQEVQRSANTSDVESAVAAQLRRATADLSRVDPKTLNANALAQYNLAKGFIRQAQDALRVKNYSQAEELVKKASTILGLLIKL